MRTAEKKSSSPTSLYLPRSRCISPDLAASPQVAHFFREVTESMPERLSFVPSQARYLPYVSHTSPVYLPYSFVPSQAAVEDESSPSPSPSPSPYP